MTPREQLSAWIAGQHAGQQIKRTNKPYVKHLVAVADMVKSVIPLGYEIGICHDVLEDTEITEQQLLKALTSFGYSVPDANYITGCVVELTDVFTKSSFPQLNKADRKQKEAARLAGISPAAQTVKYADLLYNINWVLKYDRQRAAAYLVKKRILIKSLETGNMALRVKALALIENGLASLTP